MIDPARIKAHAAKYEGQNLKFRTFLKNHADDDELDAQFLALHNELFPSYDCCQCNNCCKSYNVSVTPDEVNIIAAFLGATEANVISQYLEKDADDETGEDCYAIKSKPCPFLCSDGKCRGQSCKPAACNWRFVAERKTPISLGNKSV
jgi:hypothetical protein